MRYVISAFPHVRTRWSLTNSTLNRHWLVYLAHTQTNTSSHGRTHKMQNAYSKPWRTSRSGRTRLPSFIISIKAGSKAESYITSRERATAAAPAATTTQESRRIYSNQFHLTAFRYTKLSSISISPTPFAPKAFTFPSALPAVYVLLSGLESGTLRRLRVVLSHKGLLSRCHCPSVLGISICAYTRILYSI